MLAALAAGSAMLLSAPVAQGVAAGQAAAGTVPVNQWPEAHGNPQLTGLSGDTTVSTANASTLGVRWMANLGAQSLSSPVVGYNATLGQTVVYAGSEGGWFSAYSAASGATLWSVNLGSAIRSTPTIDGDNIWVAATYNPRLIKLDASTGAQLCSANIYAVAEASPVVATPPGGVHTVYMASNDLAQAGPVYAFKAADCSTEWTNAPYPGGGGVWDFMSYALDAPTATFPHGEPLVLFGTSDPDGGMYAVDATTGKRAWRFQTYVANADSDVGAGIAVSAPGVNGFADGVAYSSGKDGVTYAVDLTTGKKIWSFTFENPELLNGSRSTPALAGNQLLIGTSVGTWSLNARTGALNWHYVLPAGDENLGAVAVEGPPGQQVVLTTNLYGQFQVLSLATGALLYSYQTGNYIASSPAVVDRNVLFTSADGFLYDLALGGGNAKAGTTAVTSPGAGATVANTGQVVVTGTANDPSGVNQVQVTVQEDGAGGAWWDAAGKSWQPGPFNNMATLSAKGATTTKWKLTVPVRARGTVLEVRASTVGADHVADTSADQTATNPARISFTVAPSATAPLLHVSAARVAPGAQLSVSGTGFAAGEGLALDVVSSPVTQLATVTADSQGDFPATVVTIPSTTNFGPVSISATSSSGGPAGSVAVVISNNWSQFGSTPSRSSVERNDNSIVTNVAPDGRYYFDQVYNFPADAPIRTTPAIDGGSAFFGDDAGSLYAVDVHTGAQVWQDSYRSGIVSSAAVDAGTVVFGTKGATVEAVSAATGASVWSAPTSSAVESSPAVYGGTVYVGSDDGTFYALDEKTGAVKWTVALGAAIHSSPAIDATDSTVVVGDDSGRVTALTTAAGTQVWSARTGAAVTATPMVQAGVVYVGSQDGKEYALDGTSGRVVWTFATGGPITSNTAAVQQFVVVGSSDGVLYYLSVASGAEINHYDAHSAIIGVAGSPRVTIATLKNGEAVGNRISGQETTWKYYGTHSSIVSAPVINNGTIYVTGLDQDLHVFDTPGTTVY